MVGVTLHYIMLKVSTNLLLRAKNGSEKEIKRYISLSQADWLVVEL